MADTTLFTKIIQGEIPCHKLYEDEHTFAFLDIFPANPGHTLVIPKNPVEFMWDLPDEDYRAVTVTTKKLALHLRATLGTKYVAERIIGVDVPHAHVHLIPFNDTSELSTTKPVQADDAELASLAAKLAL